MGRSAAQQAAEWYPKLQDPTGQPLVKLICGHPDEARRQLADLEFSIWKNRQKRAKRKFCIWRSIRC